VNECRGLISRLPAHEQRTLIYTVIAVLSKRNSAFGSSIGNAEDQVELKALRGVPALITALVAHKHDLQVGLIDWLIGVSANATGQSHMTHRAVIVVVSNNNGRQS